MQGLRDTAIKVTESIKQLGVEPKLSEMRANNTVCSLNKTYTVDSSYWAQFFFIIFALNLIEV